MPHPRAPKEFETEGNGRNPVDCAEIYRTKRDMVKPFSLLAPLGPMLAARSSGPGLDLERPPISVDRDLSSHPSHEQREASSEERETSSEKRETSSEERFSGACPRPIPGSGSRSW